MKYTLIILLTFLVSCANIGTLGGGPSDENPPKIISNDLSETNFKAKRITLEFDEYVAFNNPEKNILLIPAHSKMKFTISGKKAIITFDTLLQDNTTYSLIINKGIQDVNANNPLVYSAVFSTGPFRDSAKISVQIPNYKDYKSLKVALTESTGFDSFKTFKPAYVFNVTDENLTFSGLNRERRNLWLFTDANSDGKPDFYKPAALKISVQADSAYIIPVAEWMQPFAILSSKRDSQFLKIYYTHLDHHEKSLPELTGVRSDQFVYTTADSAVLFSPLNSSLNRIKAMRQDTVSDLGTHKEVYRMVEASIRLIKHKTGFQLNYNLPVYYNDSAIYQYNPKRSIFYKNKPDSFVLNHYDLKSSSIQHRDTFRVSSVNTSDASKLTFLGIQIKDTSNLYYDFKLIKDGKVVSFESGIKSYDVFLEPGTYLLQIFTYKSRYRFNPFEMVESAFPIYEKTLYLKASWEEILSVKL